MHNVTLTTRLIGHCQRLGVDFIVLNGRYSQRSFAVHANHQRQAQRRLAQYHITSQPSLALPLARRLICHKLHVGTAVLRRTTTTDPSRAIGELALQAVLSTQCADAAQLRGHEGAAQRRLFEHWRQCLPESLRFTSRQRRPPPDPVNALFSLTFTLLHEEAVRQCLLHGLDPWLGFYHQLAPGRLSLACDLMEPLRPLAEAWVVELFLDGELDLRHFSYKDGGCLLGKAGREHYYALWHERLAGWSKRLGRYAGLLARYIDDAGAGDRAIPEVEGDDDAKRILDQL